LTTHRSIALALSCERQTAFLKERGRVNVFVQVVVWVGWRVGAFVYWRRTLLGCLDAPWLG